MFYILILVQIRLRSVTSLIDKALLSVSKWGMYICYCPQIMQYMSKNDSKKDFDWAQMVYNIDGMVSMENNVMTNMMESIQTFNFSRIGEAVEIMMNNMMKGSTAPASQTSNTENTGNSIRFYDNFDFLKLKFQKLDNFSWN